MKTILLCITAFQISLAIYAQAPVTQWAKTHYNYSNASVLSAPDGSLITVGGNTAKNGTILRKYSLAGVLQWEKSYIYGINGEVSGGVLFNTTEGGFNYFLTDNTEEDIELGYENVYLIKTDADGEVQTNTKLEFGQTILTRATQTSDGNYLISAIKSTGGALYKISPTGSKLWETSIPYYAMYGKETPDGGYIIGAYDEDSENSYLIKLDNSRNTVWQTQVTVSPYIFQTILNIEPSSSGSYLLLGFLYNQIGNSNSFAAVGWIANFSASGTLNWEKYDTNHIPGALLKLSNDDFIVGNNYNLTKYSSTGNLLWSQDYPILEDSQNYQMESLISTNDGGFAITGWGYDKDDTEFTQVMKLSGGSLSVADIPNSKIKIYPNPVKDILYFSEKMKEIKIYNIEGKLIKTDKNIENISLNHLPKGTYILQGEYAGGKKTQVKIIKE